MSDRQHTSVPKAFHLGLRPFCLLVAISVLGGCKDDSAARSEAATIATKASDFATEMTCPAPASEAVRIAGGTFIMGQDDLYPEEGPLRETRVDTFWIDRHEVTNAQFARFVAQTSYVTVAEKPVDPAVFGVPEDHIPADMLKPGSAVFSPPDTPSTRYTDWWTYVPGANWRNPYGPGGPQAQDGQPVVHLAWDDMAAYAAWAEGRLPTEAEWEFAANAGQPTYKQQPEQANSWQGAFPAVNTSDDGFKGIAPVGCYAPNANGLYDMVGNVWEVTMDIYRPGHDQFDNDNPRGPDAELAADPNNPPAAMRVMKGGSYLCAPNYCQRYRPQSRHPSDSGMGTSNVGFRLAYDADPAAQ